ncbi:MAG: LTA synthase family protein [Bacteroidales bacterium]|nr:LTA synthase family protein [Bacteroidales bacterium]
MKKRLIAVVVYSLYWLVFFFTARLFFIITHFGESVRSGTGELLGTFSHGIKLDISAIAYILILPVLLLITGILYKGRWWQVFVKWYTYLLIILCSIIVVTDTILYTYWGFRMDVTALIYMKTPEEAIASVSLLLVAATFFGIIVFSALFIFIYRKLVERFFNGFQNIRPWLPSVIFFLILWASLIIPVRGGVGIAPINAGSVYFSKNMFINHTSINVAWNLFASVVNQKPVSNPYYYSDPGTAKNLIDSLTRKTFPTVRVLNNQRPNILIIVLESFGSPMIGPLGGDTLTTPCFNRYVDDGILFTNFYSSGFRTDKAMPAILNGYPAQPVASIMKEPKKTQSLPGIVKVFNELGYRSSFWYGGEIDFANFNSFIINSGFSQIMTKENFSHEKKNFSNWGVHDHIFFNTLRDSMEKVSEPFLNVVLTLSSHEPFEIPMSPVFKGNDVVTKFRNSIYYTDNALGSFLDWASKKEWWDNTLVILLADHYRRHSSEVQAYTEDIFKIPMLWFGGAVSIRGMRVKKFGSQVDLPLTLLHQLDLDGDYPFGKDMFSEQSCSFSFYTFNEGFGFITDSSKYIYDHKLGKPVLEEGRDPEWAGKLGKAYLQVLFDDFLKR